MTDFKYRMKLPRSILNLSMLEPSAFASKPYAKVSVNGKGGLVLPEIELLPFFSEFNSKNYAQGESVEIKLEFIQMTDFDYFQLPEFEGF
jgi:hypothetical protein